MSESVGTLSIRERNLDAVLTMIAIERWSSVSLQTT